MSVKVKALVFDIEGTTTDINFVHQVLFPYSNEKIEKFVMDKYEDKNVSSIIESINAEFLSGKATQVEVIALLKKWIAEDKKIGQLKKLQGLIWEFGYKNSEFKGHVYGDVIPAFKKWISQGLKLYIYSSGSVHAQKLLFAHTSEGDICELFSGHFDTQIGHKKEAKSYTNILKEIKLSPSEVVFFSDIEQELDAAKEVGMKTIHINRDDLFSSSKHKIAKNFTEINFE